MSSHKLLAILLFFIASCQDSENPIEDPVIEDTEAPVITVLSPDTEKVKGNITITAQAEDKIEVANIQLFMDDDLLQEANAEKITIQLNTKSINDGLHAIKVVASDKAGNSSNKTVNIEVRNVLFKAKIPSDYVISGAEIYFIFSKNDGSLIEYKKLENGMNISIETPEDFDPESSFVFSTFYHYDDPHALINLASHYGGIEAGEFILNESGKKPSVKGTYQFNLSEIPSSYQVQFEGVYTSDVFVSSNVNSFSSNISLLNNTSDLFAWLRVDSETTPVYKYIKEVRIGESSDHNYSDLSKMKSHYIDINPAAKNYNVIVYGLPDNSTKGIETYYTSNGPAGTQLKLYYPAEVFPKYRFEISYEADGFAFSNNSIIGTNPPASFQYLNANLQNVQYTNRKLEVLSTGSYDIIGSSAFTVEFVDNIFKNEGYGITIFKGQSITLPELPAEIQAYNVPSTEEYNFNSISMVEFKGISSSHEYFQKCLFDTYNSPSTWPYLESISKTFLLNPSGGRLPAKISEAQMERLNQYAPGILLKY